jgi:hypothetical protein
MVLDRLPICASQMVLLYLDYPSRARLVLAEAHGHSQIYLLNLQLSYRNQQRLELLDLLTRWIVQHYGNACD